jgi:hypothetical protein
MSTLVFDVSRRCPRCDCKTTFHSVPRRRLVRRLTISQADRCSPLKPASDVGLGGMTIRARPASDRGSHLDRPDKCPFRGAGAPGLYTYSART